MIFVILYFSIILIIQHYASSDLLIVFLSLSMIVPIIYLVMDRYKQKEKFMELRDASIRAELGLLKSQINPHFFFNTLNNLYVLAAEKSDLTQEVIYKLSEMMRFTIYEGRKESVSVKDEINYLNHYIQLHQLRYKNKVDVQFQTEVSSLEQRIPPLLFINLLENAFKHGAETLTEHAYIHLKLLSKPEQLIFTIENNFEKEAVKKKSRKGIGIENLKRRLDLLFPNSHYYQTISKNNVYKTYVKIQLN